MLALANRQLQKAQIVVQSKTVPNHVADGADREQCLQLFLNSVHRMPSLYLHSQGQFVLHVTTPFETSMSDFREVGGLRQSMF